MSTTSNRSIQIHYLRTLQPNVGQDRLEFVCGCLSLRAISVVGRPIYPPGYCTTGVWLGAYPVSVFLDTETGNFGKMCHVDHFCLKEPFDEATMRAINSVAFEHNLRLGKRKP